MGVLLQGGEGLPGGYAADLIATLLALVAVCIVAWVLLRFGARRGLGLGRGRNVRVLERVSLEPRRSLYLVRVADKVLLIGAGDGAAPAVLAELDPDSLELPEPGAGTSFAEILGRLTARKGDSE